MGSRAIAMNAGETRGSVCTRLLAESLRRAAAGVAMVRGRLHAISVSRNKARTTQLEIEERLVLGTKKTLLLVRCREQRFLLSLTPEGVTTPVAVGSLACVCGRQDRRKTPKARSSKEALR